MAISRRRMRCIAVLHQNSEGYSCPSRDRGDLLWRSVAHLRFPATTGALCADAREKLMRVMTLITMCIGPSLSSDRGILNGREKRCRGGGPRTPRECEGGGPRTSRKTRAKHMRILELQRPDQSHESIQMSRAVKANVLDHVVTYVCYVQKRACEVKTPCQN